MVTEPGAPQREGKRELGDDAYPDGAQGSLPGMARGHHTIASLLLRRANARSWAADRRPSRVTCTVRVIAVVDYETRPGRPF